MRSTFAIATVAAAAVAVSAQNCNPSYDVATSGECFTNCNAKAGQDFVPGWTMDHTSTKFLDSLKLMCTKGTSEYMAFMTKAGMCMAGCSDPQDLFIAEFAGACTWYATHKDDVCGAAEPTTAAPAATTAAPVTTNPPAATTTDAPSTNGAPASSGASSSPASVSSGSPAASNNGTIPVSAASSPAASANDAKPSTSPSAGVNQADKAGSAASKLQISGFVIAMIASAGYLAL